MAQASYDFNDILKLFKNPFNSHLEAGLKLVDYGLNSTDFWQWLQSVACRCRSDPQWGHVKRFSVSTTHCSVPNSLQRGKAANIPGFAISIGKALKWLQGKSPNWWQPSRCFSPAQVLMTQTWANWNVFS